MDLRWLAGPRQRGIVLDVTVFLLNLAVMRALAGGFLALVRATSRGSVVAQIAVGVYFLGMFTLPVAASVLKRWSFHQRRDARSAEESAWGCLMNPAFYLAVSLTVATTAAVLFGERVWGVDFHQRAGIFLPLMLGVLVVSVAQTVMVYRYFSPPRGEPGPFLRSARAAWLGDLCVFVNVILYQILWNIAMGGRFERVQDGEDFLGRLFFVWFLSILVYFPPRLFYLADDAKRPVSWGTITLATSPVILRVMGWMG